MTTVEKMIRVQKVSFGFTRIRNHREENETLFVHKISFYVFIYQLIELNRLIWIAKHSVTGIREFYIIICKIDAKKMTAKVNEIPIIK